MFKNKEEYRYFAFTTDLNASFDLKRFKRLNQLDGVITSEKRESVYKVMKSIYTLIGTCKEYDHFKNLGKNTFHKWKREKVYSWFKAGKIKFIVESNKLDWYE